MSEAGSRPPVRRGVGCVAAAVLAIGALPIGGCTSVKQQAFGSPEDAVEAMVGAVGPELDRMRLREIFGPDIDEALPSGDEVADRAQREEFLAKYHRGHRLVPMEDGSRVLEIGTDHWPFAFPLVQRKGGWMFDTDAGIDEMLSRRIGANELDTIQTCLAIVDAQREYALLDVDRDGVREYAPMFVSDPGERNGLFWPTAGDEPPSPLGELIGAAAEAGYERGDAYHGYRFKMLFGQGPGARGGAWDYRAGGRLIGGYGVLAWPASYGNSGIKSFITNHDGVVYEKDLGDDTDRAARSIGVFDPAGWERVATGAAGDGH